MKSKKRISLQSCEEQNFWISYADLMAGLLFVFLLIIGAIVVKYVIIQSDITTLKTDLEKKREALKMSAEELSRKKRKLEKIQNELNTIEDKNSLLMMKIRELEKIKNMYNEAQKELNQTKEIIQLTKGEKEVLEKLLIQKDEEYKKLSGDLDTTKKKIKNLTGIRIKVIKALKKEMGKMITIDPKSGAIRFSSNILFGQGEYKLKESSKEKLRRVLSRYLKTLLENRNIKQHIERIIIEGHTNSDGDYFQNLTLSQKRASEVMKFIFSLGIGNKKDLRKYLTASGRSFSDLIYKKNGEEDKEASRRIEIKFRIKNERAIKEIEKFLEGKF